MPTVSKSRGLEMIKHNASPRSPVRRHINARVRPLGVVVHARRDQLARKLHAVVVLVHVEAVRPTVEERVAPVDADVVGRAGEGHAAHGVLGSGTGGGAGAVAGGKGGDRAHTVVAFLQDGSGVGG